MQTCPACNGQNKDTANFCAFCGHRLAGLLPTGAVLQGRYRITQLLGKGGMGAVYQAQDLRLGGRPVAVKENFDASAEAQAQFQLEANMLANLNHSNLPRVIDHFIEASGKQYLVMDFVEGEDLEQMLARQGRLVESQALVWFGQVCEAVEHMHRQSPPIIHALGRRPKEYSVPPAPAPAVPSVQPLAMPRPAPVPAPVPTPAAVPAPFQFASGGQRFMAFFIDTIILTILVWLLATIAELATDSTGDVVALCSGLLTLVGPFGYYTYFHARSGQTPGKKALGIKVVSSDGSPLTTGKSAGRAFGYMLTWALTYVFVGFIGFLWMFRDENRQTWHDKMAGTYVIKV